MITNTLTFLFSLVALFSYFVYIVGKHGTLGFLFSAAIFLLISAFVDHVEYITIGLLIIGLTLSLYLQQYLPHKTKYEGFEGAELPKEEEEIAEEKKEEPKTDAFEGSVPETPPTTSTNAPAEPTPVINQEAVSKSVTAALSQLQESPTIKAAIQPSAATKAGSNENFQEPSAGLFKLGELPSEMKKGPFVDVASTMTKAMSSLKPEQMAAMTAESQSLMETQKNLMGMLKSMGPVLQDGRQLLDTFGSIFGGLGGLGKV